MNISNPYPKNIAQGDREKFEVYKNYERPPFNRISLENKYLTPSGIIFSLGKGLEKGSIFENIGRKRFFLSIAIGNFFLRKRYYLKEDKNYLVVHHIWSIGGYYHWLVESLARLEKFGSELNQFTLLLPENAKKYDFILESLTAFHLADIEYYPSSRLTFLKKLTISANPKKGGYHHPDLIKSLRTRLVKESGKRSRITPKKRIYISREKSRSRSIVNEQELRELLENKGFQTFHFEELNFWDQVRLCSSAEVIISSHGAGLSNILFQGSGGKVIELLSAKVHRLMIYWSLACALNLDYYYFLCSQVSEDDSFDEANLIAPVEKVEELLSSM